MVFHVVLLVGEHGAYFLLSVRSGEICGQNLRKGAALDYLGEIVDSGREHGIHLSPELSIYALGVNQDTVKVKKHCFNHSNTFWLVNNS